MYWPSGSPTVTVSKALCQDEVEPCGQGKCLSRNLEVGQERKIWMTVNRSLIKHTATIRGELVQTQICAKDAPFLSCNEYSKLTSMASWSAPSPGYCVVMKTSLR